MSAIATAVDELFNDVGWLTADDWKIYVGVSKYFPKPVIPAGWVDRARAEALGVVCPYGIALFKKPVSVTTLERDALVQIPSDPKDRRTIRVEHAFFLKRRADLVWDDIHELEASAFPYREVATKLGHDVRKKVYSRPLPSIHPPEIDSSTPGFFSDGSLFMAAAAEKATYDASDALSYYEKWRKNDKRNLKSPPYTFDNLSDRYFQINFRAFDLEKAYVYLYLRLDDRLTMLSKLFMDPAAKHHPLRYDAMKQEGLPPEGDYFSIVNNYLRIQKGKKRPVLAEAWFFYSIEGTDKTPDFFNDSLNVEPGISLTSVEEVIDPQCMVQSIRGLECDQIDIAQKVWTRRSWVKELVRLRFSDPWVWFWKNAYIEMFYEIDRDKLFLNELRQEHKKSEGEIKKRLGEFIQLAEKDKTVHLVRRGSMYGKEKRVIGSDTSHVYFYNNEKGLMTRVPMYSFWKHINVTQISAVIYNNTKGMIPIAKVLAWGGLFVAGWGIVGTTVVINGFRQYVYQKVKGAVIDQLLKVQFEQLRDRVLLTLISAVLSLFPVDSSTNRFYAFIKGFIQGYSHDSFIALFKRWESIFIRLEPPALHAIRLLMQIEAALRWVDEKLSRLKGFLTRAVAEALMERFVQVSVHAATGLIGLINNLYFLEYEQVKPLLDAVAEINGEKIPTRSEWDRIRHAHWIQTFRNYQEAITKEGANVKEIYADVKKGIVVLQTAVRIAGSLLLLEIGSGGGLVAAVWFAVAKSAGFVVKMVKTDPGKVIAGNLAGGLIIASAVSKEFRALVTDALVDLGKLTQVPKIIEFAVGNPERMERFGQLLGVLIGGATLNKHVFGGAEKPWTQRWKAEKAGGKSYGKFVTKHFVRSQLSVSPVLPAIKLALFNYVFLIEKVIDASKKAWGDLEDELETILVGTKEDIEIFGEENDLTLAKLIRILGAIDKVLTDWLKKLAETPGLTEKIAEMADKVKTLGPTELPTFEDLRDGKLKEGWVREAVMFVMLSHLHASLLYLVEAIRSMLTPVNEGDAETISAADVLMIFGFQLDKDTVDELLDKNFEETFKEEEQTAAAAP